MKNIIYSFLLFQLILSVTISAYADSQKTLKLGTVENLPPFSYYEDGILKGIDIDVINEIGNRIHIFFEIQPLPWIRVISSLQTGDVDGAFSLYANEERKEICIYLGVVHYDNLGLVAQKKKKFSFNKIDDLFGKSIVKGAGVYISKDFQEATTNKKITVYEINDTQMGNIKMLCSNRADAAIGVIETMLFYAKNFEDKCEIVKIDKLIDENRPGFFVISKKSLYSSDLDTQEKIQKGIIEIMGDGTYDRILEKYQNYFVK